MNQSEGCVLWGSLTLVDWMCISVSDLGSENGAIPPPLDEVLPDRRTRPNARNVQAPSFTPVRQSLLPAPFLHTTCDPRHFQESRAIMVVSSI